MTTKKDKKALADMNKIIKNLEKILQVVESSAAFAIKEAIKEVKYAKEQWQIIMHQDDLFNKQKQTKKKYLKVK